MKRKHLAAMCRNSAAMLELADQEPPDHARGEKLKEWRKSVRRSNQGQANILRTVAEVLEAGEEIEG